MSRPPRKVRLEAQVLARSADAPRAGLHVALHAVDDEGGFLDIRQPASRRAPLGVAHVVAEGYTLAADVTAVTHDDLSDPTSSCREDPTEGALYRGASANRAGNIATSAAPLQRRGARNSNPEPAMTLTQRHPAR